MVVTVSRGTQRCQGISLIYKKNTAHRLVAQTVDHLWGLSLIGTHHLGTIHFNHMSAVEITDRSQYLAQLSGDGRLSRSGITRQDDMHRHLLLLSQAALCTMHGILHRIGHLTDGTLHLVHADVPVEVLQDILYSTLFRHIALDVVTLHLGSIGTTADELGEDIFGGLAGQMAVAEEFVLDLNLIFEIAGELILGFL